MKGKVGVLFIILVAVLLGACREFLFVNLNYQIDHLQRSTEFSYAHSMFQACVSNWSLGELVKLKWAFSGTFILIMLLLCLVLSTSLFGGNKYARPIIIFFVVTGSLALILHQFSSASAALHVLSIKLLHLLQYPVILLILLVAAQLKHRARHTEST